jgi:putative oxidoreductase
MNSPLSTESSTLPSRPSFAERSAAFFSSSAHAFDSVQPLFALALRVYVSWQFLKSGWLKISDWEQTLSLFESEYHVPVLSPYAAALAGTFGELFFSSLLILGLGGRFAPLGLLAVNCMAVISYSQVLLADGAEAALAQHVLWGLILVVLTIYGQGALALDRLWSRKYRRVW